MANSTIPGLVAVTVPAGTDLLGVRQSGDLRDKKLTVTQLLSLAPGGGDVTKVGTPVNNQVGIWTGDGTIEGDADFTWDGAHIRLPILNDQVTPTLGFGDGGDGLFSAADGVFALSLNGLGHWQWTDGTDTYSGFVSGSGAMRNVGTSATVATICPNRNNLTSGLGQNASDQVSIIGGGVELARFTEAVAAQQFAIALSGSSVVPELTSLSDLDTGFRWTGANEVQVICAATRSWHFLSTAFFADASDGPIIFNTFGSATVPSIAIERGDPDSGIGKATNDSVSLIAGGVEGLRIQEALGLVAIDTRGSSIVNANTTLTPLSVTAGTDPAADGGDLDLSSGDSGVAATGDGGAVNILAGASVATTGDGGVVSIKSGAGFFQGAGGDMLFEVGSGGAAGPGTSGNFFVNTTVGLTAAAGLQVPIPGLVAIYGIGRSGEGPAGDLELWAGYAAGTGGGSLGGDLLLFGGGQGGGAGAGGNAHLYGGESDTQPGFAEVEGGTATVGGAGGNAFLKGGPGFGTNFAGGFASVNGGAGIGTGGGGSVTVRGGQSGSGATGNGGFIDIIGGLSTATNGDGGDINLISGTGNGGGSAGIINISLGGSAQFTIDSLLGIQGVAAAGPAIRNVGASAVTPNLVPNKTDSNTGIGWNAADALSIVAGGVELARFVEAVGIEQTLILNNDNTGLPDLAVLGDPDTGWHWTTANAMAFIGGGTRAWNFSTAQFFSQFSNGAGIINAAQSSGVAVFLPDRSDADTGIGADSTDGLQLVSGGVVGLALNELNAGVIQVPSAVVGVTAFATGGQGSATQLNNTNSVIATVATTGDSVKLPPVFLINSIMFIKNDGANAADVFPHVGGNLGAGLNTAISLAAGESASFIATIASSTWTPWIVSVGGGGGGDVTKVGTPVNNQVGVWTGDGTLEGDADLTFDGTILTMGLTGRVRTGVGTVSQAAFGFATEINTGIYRQAAGSLGVTLSGTGGYLFQTGSFFANLVGGPQMMREAATATNPTFVPRLSDTDSGIGSGAADEVNLIAGGLNCLAVREVGAVPQIGFYGTTPAPQSAAYSRAATIVESRALLASASATTVNNNNVLAALIADLQALGLLG